MANHILSNRNGFMINIASMEIFTMLFDRDIFSSTYNLLFRNTKNKHILFILVDFN